jgi:glycosyltransferase involved in cell wall biosynthesis
METILAQSTNDWELIICDSFSDDGSWEFFRKFKDDPRIRMYQVPREGIYAGWNECLRRATGEYIYIATSDDTMSPHCLEQLLDPLVRRKELMLAACDYDLIDDEGHRLEKSGPNDARNFYEKWMSVRSIRTGTSDFLAAVCLGPTWATMTTVLFRRSLLERTGLFRTDRGSFADYEWAMRAVLSSDIAFIPLRLATWRIHGSQATGQWAKDLRKLSWFNLEMVRSVIDDESLAIPKSWKEGHRWADEILRVWQMEYWGNLGLDRGLARTQPWQFARNVWGSLRSEPAFLLRQLLRGFAWSTQFSPKRVEIANHLVNHFDAPWPPKAMNEKWQPIDHAE